jgi:ligand-binding SRPBCC domain-containing protein
MVMHSIKAVQKIPVSLGEAWDFFSDPANLKVITPDSMRFRVISEHTGEKMFAGQILEYKLRPLWGIPLYWMTEITEVKPKEFFADKQRKGPYKLWYHRHYFREIEGGVEMTDIVQYKNPAWIAGRVLNRLFIRRKLRELFEYRFRKVEELFGEWKDQRPEITSF